jgi:hypothetical protein
MTVDEFFEALDTIENAKYDLDYTHSFKKSVKLCSKSSLDLNLLLTAIVFLVQNGNLEDIYYPHPLKGFLLFDTGTHSYLFNSKRLRKGKI